MRRLTWFALPFGGGCLLCQYILPEAWRAWAAAGTLVLGLLAALLHGRAGSAARIGSIGLAAGLLWYMGYAAVYLAPAEALVGTETLLQMELADYPEAAPNGARAVVRVPGLRGKALYYGDLSLLDYAPGSCLEDTVRCYSAAAPAETESTYFTSQGIFLRLYGAGEETAAAGEADDLRYLPQRLAKTLRETVTAHCKQPARGLLLALLTGDRTDLDEQSLSDLTEAGLLHITAVSGLHCGFLLSLLGVLVLRRQRLTALLGYPVLLGYMLMTGCTPSVVRSCVMMGFLLLAPLVGREGDGLTSLSAALLVILLANPFAVASVSLQLSFSAAAGVLLIAPGIQEALLSRCPVTGWLGQNICSFLTGTLAASLGVLLLTAPLSAVYFGTLPLISPLANLLVLWMAPVLFAAALVGTVLLAIFPALAALSVGMEALAQYVLWVAHLLAGVPGHSVRFISPAAGIWLALVYTIIGICVLSKDRPRKYAVAAAAAAICLLAAKLPPRLLVRSDALTAVITDVGQGAATLLHAGEVTALVDCGSLGSPRQAGQAVADTMELYGWDRLDYAALTHYHTDHAGGLESLLARVEVGTLLLPQLLESEDQADLQREILALAERYGISVRYIEEPAELALGTAVLTVYPPVTAGSANEEGLTFLCTAGDFDLLITGDMNVRTEAQLVETYALPDIEVLAVGHHGSKYSTSEELLDAVSPEIGVISVGSNNFGHPTAEAMGRMAAAGMTLYRTDQQGNVLIRIPQ